MLAARFILLALLLVACDQTKAPPLKADPAEPFVRIVVPLIDPARLDALQGKRAANRSLRRVCFVLESARRDGHAPAAVIDQSQEALGIAGTPRAAAVKAALLRNLDILGKLGCLDEAGMGKLGTSNAPMITRGPYAGDIASVDHIIPRSIAEELDEKLYNLEFMPSRMNSGKGNRVTERQVQIGRRWNRDGLLSDEGLRAVEAAAEKP